MVQGDAVGVDAGPRVQSGTRPSRRTTMRSAVALLPVVGMVLVAGCQAGGTTAKVAAEAVEKKVPQPRIAVVPAASTMGVRPDAAIKVTATDGKLTAVT